VVVLLCTVRTCGAPLTRETRRVVCERGHSFDVARSGYVNLLQPQDRRSREPGDSADAVAARRRVLERYGAPFVEGVLALLDLTPADALLDAGCGEGHHLGSIRSRFGCEAHGVDISVPAIEAAARRYADCTFVVANADRFLPYADASFAAVSSITARLNPSEFRRVLRPGGTLLVVIAGYDDLVELRGQSRDRVERTVEMFAPTFSLVRHERASTRVTLDRAALRDVVVSTYRPKRMPDAEAMEVTMSRDLLLFT
jgi:23S rRNA (guanine745-N1)-methyltransferase